MAAKPTRRSAQSQLRLARSRRESLQTQARSERISASCRDARLCAGQEPTAAQRLTVVRRSAPLHPSCRAATERQGQLWSQVVAVPSEVPANVVAVWSQSGGPAA